MNFNTSVAVVVIALCGMMSVLFWSCSQGVDSCVKAGKCWNGDNSSCVSCEKLK